MLTSGEVQQLLRARGQKLDEVPAVPLDSIISGIPDSPQLYGIPGGSGRRSSHRSIRLSVAGLGLKMSTVSCPAALLYSGPVC